VDGHTSTNDTLLLAASGNAETRITPENESAFADAIEQICIRLAIQLVADGEGAARFMKIRVTGAASADDANMIAVAVGSSPLVKTAIAGGDPNWGRIVSAAGYAGPPIQPDRTELSLCGTKIFSAGGPLTFDAAPLSERIRSCREVDVELVVGDGPGTAVRWASDLTVQYVRFNSEYTT